MLEDKTIQICKLGGKEFFINRTVFFRVLNTQNLIVGTISFEMSFVAAL